MAILETQNLTGFDALLGTFRGSPPCFHLAESIALSEPTSDDLGASAATGFSSFGFIWQMADHAFAQFNFGATALHVHQAAADFFAGFVFGNVMVDRGGLELLHAQPDAAALFDQFPEPAL